MTKRNRKNTSRRNRSKRSRRDQEGRRKDKRDQRKYCVTKGKKKREKSIVKPKEKKK